MIGNPAARALTPELVPHELLPGALALRGVAGQIGVIAGPALGGIIFAVEPVAVYATAAALLTLSLVAILAMQPVARSLVTTEPPGWDSLVAGVRFIFGTRMLLGAIGLDLFGVLLGDSIALAPVFARSILDVGPIGLGLLRTAPAVGALASAVMLARRPLRRPAGRTLLVVVATFGASMIVFGISKSLPLSLAALCVSGFVDMISVNIRQTAVAMLTPPQLQGRVSAVEWVFISASNELGAFESGALARLIGTVPAVVAGGSAMIAVAATWSPHFRARPHGQARRPAAGAGMSREDVQALLEAHTPADAKELADRAAMLHFLEHLPSPFSSDQPAAHFTASALVLDESRADACLVLHRKLGLWLQPGGHVEPDDPTLADAALREVREETGLDGRLAAVAPVHLDITRSPSDRAWRRTCTSTCASS